jgi:hypothetical protein
LLSQALRMALVGNNSTKSLSIYTTKPPHGRLFLLLL